jgi:16S rRNA (guanine527-N7)-methyltransferase
VKHPADTLRARCAGMGVDVDAPVAQALAGVLKEMLTEPQNLSSVRTMDEAVWVHGVDSLGGLLLPEITGARDIVDLGSGGGFPGLALAAALPGVPVTLVESEGRKADWLTRAAAGRFPNVRVVADRSETLARAERGIHHVATARALGALPVVMELAAPFLASDGVLVAWRGRPGAGVGPAERDAGEALGLVHDRDVPVAAIPDVSRHFSVWRKVSPTPDRYPRRPGMAAKRPLA